MRHIIASLIVFLLPLVAAAQPADFPLALESGVYTVKARMGGDAGTTEFCVVRVGLDSVMIEYGCVPAGPNENVQMEILVMVTQGTDAEIRGYAVAIDSFGITEISAHSLNAAIIDFTPLMPPVLVE